VKKNVLIIGNCNIYGGVGHMIKEYCERLYSDKIHFDILYYGDCEGETEKYLRNINATYYHVPKYTKHPLQFLKYMKKLCKSKKYDLIHCHASTAMLLIYAIPIKIINNTPIIYQSHDSGADKSAILHCFFRPFIKVFCTKYISVSWEAGIWMFNKSGINSEKHILLQNGIDSSAYLFNPKTRNNIRMQLNIGDKFIIGNVGRFEKQKNHKLIIDIFEKIHRLESQAVLLLIGQGSLKKKVQTLVKEKNLEDVVIFCDYKKNISDYYSAMDLFLFPSIHEGMGLVAVEAQLSGLPVVASYSVPKEVKVSESFYQFNLSDSLDLWVDKIMELKQIGRCTYSKELFEKSGYEINQSAEKLRKIYESI